MCTRTGFTCNKTLQATTSRMSFLSHVPFKVHHHNGFHLKPITVFVAPGVTGSASCLPLPPPLVPGGSASWQPSPGAGPLGGDARLASPLSSPRNASATREAFGAPGLGGGRCEGREGRVVREGGVHVYRRWGGSGGGGGELYVEWHCGW